MKLVRDFGVGTATLSPFDVSDSGRGYAEVRKFYSPRHITTSGLGSPRGTKSQIVQGMSYYHFRSALSHTLTNDKLLSIPIRSA